MHNHVSSQVIPTLLLEEGTAVTTGASIAHYAAGISIQLTMNAKGG